MANVTLGTLRDYWKEPADAISTAGSTSPPNVLQVGGVDSSTTLRTLLLSSQGEPQVELVNVEGTRGSALPSKTLPVGGADSSTNLRTIRVSTAGDVIVEGSFTPADSSTNRADAQPVAAYMMALNSTGKWDRWRRNLGGTLLASAARTAAAASADQTNYNAKAVVAYLRVSAASTAGGLQLQVQGKDPVSGVYYQINTSPSNATAAALKTYIVGQGLGAVTGDITQNTNNFVPDTWRVNVAAATTHSYTYSVGYSLIV